MCSECSRRKKNNVEEERENREDECNKREKKNGGAGLLERDSRSRYESVTSERKEDVYRRNEEKEASLRGGHRRGRTKSSSCSSYYSLSSGDLDAEVLDQDEHLVGESSSGYGNEPVRYEKSRIEGQVSEEFERLHEGVQEHEEVSELRKKAGRSNVDWDSRKTSEKKLAELSIEELQSREESSQEYSRMAKTHEKRRSSVHDQSDDRVRNSVAGVSSEQGSEKHYSHVDDQLIRHSESRRKYRDETASIHSSTAEMASHSRNQISSREENLSLDVDINLDTTEHRKAVRRIAEEDIRRGSSYAMSEIQDVADERISVSNQQFDSRTNIQTEEGTSYQSSIQQTSEQHHRRDQRISAQIDLRRKSEHVSEVSEINESRSKMAYISQSEFGRKNLEEQSTLVSTTSAEAEEYFLADKQSQKRLETGKGSSSASQTEIVIGSQKSSQQKLIEQESNLTPVVRLIGETNERYNETDDTLKQLQSRRVTRKPGSPATSQQRAKEPSGSEASLILVSQSREENIDANEMKKRSTQAILMPPPSQLIARSSLREDSTSGHVYQEVSGEASEYGSIVLDLHSGRVTNVVQNDQPAGEMDETCGESVSLPTQEDSLGSAHRLESSSTHFVDEFIEKAKHEISTSETRMTHEYGEHTQDTSDKSDSADPKMKGQDGSRQSSGGSRAKGPSDDMWDEAGTSVQEPSEREEVPEQNSATETAVMKRTGRSLWNLMGDIVRLRWGSHSQAPSSAARSESKASPGESASSEAWFSGREQDDNTVEKPKRQKTSRTRGGVLSQSGSGETSNQGQGEVSETMRSRDKARLPEGSIPPSLNKLDIVPATGGLSLSTTNEFQEGNQLKVTPSSRQEAASSSTQPAGSVSSSVVDEISQSATQSESPGSGRKSGEFKQRKFQRSAQVLKDRFDEWEEAYQVESEQRKNDEKFMREALIEAKKAADNWEVPVGAVLVQHGKVIARGYNLVEELRDSTAHAEMICIREGSNVLRSWRLADTTLYVTLEPCPMCAGAILQARIHNLVWGAPNKLLGADGSWIRLFPGPSEEGKDTEPSEKPPAPVHPFHPKMNIRRGILESECAEVMQQFFQRRRKKKATNDNDDPPPPPSCLPIAPHPSKILTKMQDAFHITFCL